MCDNGFTISGTKTSVCNNGIFQPPLGLCLPSYMGPKTANTSLANTNSVTNFFKINTSIIEQKGLFLLIF